MNLPLWVQVGVILIVVGGTIVASVADHVAALRRGEKRGEDRLRAHLRELYYRDRTAFEYEIVAKRPLESVRQQLLPSHFGFMAARSAPSIRRPIE